MSIFEEEVIEIMPQSNCIDLHNYIYTADSMEQAVFYCHIFCIQLLFV